jgi:YD repeat-containing protein
LIVDVENRLISAVDPNSTVLFEYDDAGRRFEKSHNGTVRHYLYDGVDLIAVYDDADNLIQRYVHGPGVDEPLVWYDYDIQGTLQAKRWFYADHQGSIIATANTSGSTDHRSTPTHHSESLRKQGLRCFAIPGKCGMRRHNWLITRHGIIHQREDGFFQPIQLVISTALIYMRMLLTIRLILLIQ